MNHPSPWEAQRAEIEFRRTMRAQRQFAADNRAAIQTEWNALVDPTREPCTPELKARADREWSNHA